MAATLPLEALEALERHLGREDARILVRSLQDLVASASAATWNANRDQLFQLLRQEFVTRDFFEERLRVIEEKIAALRFELLGKAEADKAELLGKIEKDKAELLGKLEADKAELLGTIEADKAELLGKLQAVYEKTEKDKAELLGKIEADKAELLGKIVALFEKTEKDKAELLGRIETLKVALDRKFTLYFWILLFTIVFLNQNALEFLARIFRLLP
ncbi:hypothetical protein HRbin09_01214 [bacterium HR09]|nr:hypothetical protein HRbin09_01214 [bacterium HR09]